MLTCWLYSGKKHRKELYGFYLHCSNALTRFFELAMSINIKKYNYFLISLQIFCNRYELTTLETHLATLWDFQIISNHVLVTSTSSIPPYVPVEIHATTHGCASANFSTHGISYIKVWGRLRGYQVGQPDAFGSYICDQRNLDLVMDGVLISHGQTRSHIWAYTTGHHRIPLDTDRRYILSMCWPQV